jgi:outer membrane protein assembly factor BamB
MLIRLSIACSILMSLAGVAFGAAADWPQFRGPTGQGLSDATGVPTEWGTSRNVAWSVAIPGRGWSSPIVAGGRVYLTTSVGGASGPITLHALCLDVTDGKTIWDTEVFRPDEAAAREMHGKNSLASPTPIVTADRLYVHFGHLGTAALDLSGKIVWRQTSLKYPPVHGNGGSPALVGGTLIFNCDGSSAPFVAALDAGDGQIKWKTPRSDTSVRKRFSFSTPLAVELDGRMQVISPGSGYVASYDPANGNELWRVNYGQGYSVVPRPIFADGLIYLSSGFDFPEIYAIDPAGAKGDATGSHVVWTHPKGAPNTPSLLAVSAEIYSVSDKGFVTCLDARSGNLNWTKRMEGTFSASPVFAEGRIYLQSEAGKGFVIGAGKTFKLISEDDLGERSLASDAVIDGALFIRTEHHLWKIGASR